LDTLPDAARWQVLKGIGMVESERLINGKVTMERWHYIRSFTGVRPFAQAARGALGH